MTEPDARDIARDALAEFDTDPCDFLYARDVADALREVLALADQQAATLAAVHNEVRVLLEIKRPGLRLTGDIGSVAEKIGALLDADSR